MRQITYARRHQIMESRKVPLSTIILPPITPPNQECVNGTEFLRKLMVNKTKTNGVANEVIIPKIQEVQKMEDQSVKTPEQMRLEQNIRFLQDQHQLMLAGLHGEIEKLKARNRELQFQLIFGKSPVSSSSTSPSTPDEDIKHKLYTSPKVLTNATPLQVELLEKEMGELKIQMQEQESRNLYLSAIVDEQKKQLERYDRRREKEQQQRSSGPAEAEVELMRKLEDAESLIRRLRRENSDLRRENQNMNDAAHGSHQQGKQQYRENNGYQPPRGPRGSGRGHRNTNGHYNNRGGWFPPLHTQNFWQGGRPQHDRPHHEQATNLPDIPSLSEGPSSSHQPPQQQYQGRKGSNNNHCHNGESRKYRGGHNRGNKLS
ncbi:rab11 family-interacting protein 4B-like isoform X2 [Euwallacea fornicatus]|uniref:rab11 family-interacting protein 4B-like isoform X2 n=1 Tax=Euwallacea fornicatus TaxID=995702 RepID=UPI00338FE16C